MPHVTAPPFARLLALCATLLLGACATQPPRAPERTPTEIKADIARRIPAAIPDRSGWANDVYVALSSQQLATSADNICAVLAVIEQESTYQANPPVPGLGKIARAELGRRASALHVPAFMLDAALAVTSAKGRSYGQRIAAARTEQELSAIFEDLAGSVPLGQRLFGDLNPVHTGGPMQVSIAFAEAHGDGYPYPLQDTVRHEVFGRRGGVWFGTRHLLGYPSDYDTLLYRFADFNAGWYASRNAAFQAAVTVASGTLLVLDGDLVVHGTRRGDARVGATETAVRALAAQLDLDHDAIRRALDLGDRLEFERTDLYARVFALAEARAAKPLPRAMLPGIALQSPKITRKLTTAWFATRVDERYQRCMQR
jgi:hypothetical protein